MHRRRSGRSRIFHSWTKRSGAWTRIEGNSGERPEVIVQIDTAWVGFSVPCQFVLYLPPQIRLVAVPSGLVVGDNGKPPRCKGSVVMDAIKTSLTKVRRHTVGAGGLTLLDDQDRPIMALSRLVASGIENRKWSIAEHWDGQSLVAGRHDAHITLIYGRIDGTPGCGGLDGHYTLSGDPLKLAIGYILFARYCSPESSKSAARVMQALSGDLLVEVGPDRAVLRDEKGVTRAVLQLRGASQQ
jgi:heat shock protein HslJ